MGTMKKTHHIAYALMQTLYDAGFRPFERMADGKFNPLPFESLRVSAGYFPEQYLQVDAGIVIAELPIESVLWMRET